MPVSRDDFESEYEYLTGDTLGFEGFYEAFSSSGFDAQGSDELAMEGFFEFIHGMYPETSHSKEWWDETREIMAEYLDIDLDALDWEAIREALDEISPPG